MVQSGWSSKYSSVRNGRLLPFDQDWKAVAVRSGLEGCCRSVRIGKISSFGRDWEAIVVRSGLIRHKCSV